MSFALNRDQSIRKNIRRIVGKQLDDIVEQLTEAHSGTRDTAVHEVRKHFKKVRAILRLVRPETGEKNYRTENHCFRDAARPLTEVRDARIFIETVDALVDHFKEIIVEHAFAEIRRALLDNLRAVRKRILDEQNAFPVVVETVRKAGERVSDWVRMSDRWSSLGAGLEATFRQARCAYKTAASDPSVEKLHEWRKQARYLRHQLEILQPIWPERLKELAGETDKMGELLGDDHDLSMLRQLLTEDPQRFGEGADEEVLLALIDRRRAELNQEVMTLGDRFFQDRPRKFARRLKRYWKSWYDPATA